MKEFSFNPFRVISYALIMILQVGLGLFIFIDSFNIESKVLIDTTSISFFILGIVIFVYSIFDARVILMAIDLPIDGISIDEKSIEIFTKKESNIILFRDIKLATFSKSQTGRRISSNDIEHTRIETLDNEIHIITSFIISPKKLNPLIRINSTKKKFVENRLLRKILSD